MPKTWEEWASMVAVLTACTTGIVWIAKIWIIVPLTGSLDRLSIKIDDINKKHDGRLDTHERRLNHHKEQLEHLKIDVDDLKRKE